MIECVSACEKQAFDNHLQPWSQFFLVKNAQSQAVSLSASFSKHAGYQNPIDYLGGTSYDLKCPAVNLASTFTAQDQDILKRQVFKPFLLIATYSDKELDLYFMTKEHAASHMVCNVRKIESGLLNNELRSRINALPSNYKSRINTCYEIVNHFLDLSARESEVMYFLLQGKSSATIAETLQLSKRTIQHYIENIKIKLDCNTTQQLIELGSFLGLNEKVPGSLAYG